LKSGGAVRSSSDRDDSIPYGIIGDECHEVFLPLPGDPAHPLTRAMVEMAGLSRLRPPYLMNRPRQGMRLLMCTLRGKGGFRVGAVDGEFTPGTAWLLGPGQPVHYEIAGREWDIFWFHLKSLPQSAPECRLLAGFPDRLPGLMQGYIEEYNRCSSPGAGLSQSYAQIIAATLERLLAPAGNLGGTLPGELIFPVLTGPTDGQPALRPEIHELWLEIERRPAEEWDVRRLAELAHLSAPHLHRLCLQFYGRTPMELVTRIRMRLAQRRLSLPQSKLQTLAFELGYSTAFSFSRAFKRHCGLSPDEFRRRRQTT